MEAGMLQSSVSKFDIGMCFKLIVYHFMRGTDYILTLSHTQMIAIELEVLFQKMRALVNNHPLSYAENLLRCRPAPNQSKKVNRCLCIRTSNQCDWM